MVESGVNLAEVISREQQFHDRYLLLMRRALPYLPATVIRRRMAVAFTTYLSTLGGALSDGQPTPFLLDLPSRDLVDDVWSFMVAGLSARPASGSRATAPDGDVAVTAGEAVAGMGMGGPGGDRAGQRPDGEGFPDGPPAAGPAE